MRKCSYAPENQYTRTLRYNESLSAKRDQTPSPEPKQSKRVIQVAENRLCQCHVNPVKCTMLIICSSKPHRTTGRSWENLILAVVHAIKPGQARVDSLGKVGGQVLAELLDVRAVDLVDLAARDFDDPLVEEDEVLGDLGGTGVGVVEGGDEGGGLALVVELEVDRSMHRMG